ncbi:MAG: protein-L-isoaspartate O-methyltransferase, partial [Bacteroidia bacterium]|nr:protein-L-isoaspartate O-methyltransferase [Bacteroidia bacterium]
PRLRWGDGRLGWPTYAPFDRILITAGAEEIPPELIEQLAEKGRLVIPVGKGPNQTMIVLSREEGQLHREKKGLFRFVPLRSRQERETK